MDMTLSAPPRLLSMGVAVFIFVVWVGPIGLFVLRKHLVNATGMRLFLKTILTVLTVLTAPAVALTVLAVIFGGAEAVDVVWSLLKSAW